MEDEGSIRLERMFCPANDRDVPILFRHREAELDAAAQAGPGEPVSCLDYRFRCTGWLCPHFAVPELPTQNLLELAMKSERNRGRQGTLERQSVLERAVTENEQGAPSTHDRPPPRL